MCQPQSSMKLTRVILPDAQKRRGREVNEMDFQANGNEATARQRVMAPAAAAGRPAIAAQRRDVMKRNFIRQQGFQDPGPALRTRQYSALTFQPRVVLVWIVAGILSQSPAVFAALGAHLLLSALFPRLNPFSALYNRTFGRAPGAFRLGPAPAPRRGAETMAGAFALTIALLIFAGFHLASYTLQAILLAASLAVEFAGFCFGTFAYHLRRGNVKFALQTLPWATDEMKYEAKEARRS